jgi:hypothetical protein
MIEKCALISLTANSIAVNSRSIQGLSQQGTTKDAPSFRVVAVELPAAR